MGKGFRMHLIASFAVMVLFSFAAIAAPQQAQEQNKDAAPHPLAWAYAVLDNPLPPPLAGRDALDRELRIVPLPER